jgi:hypothetical protein
VTSDSSDLDAAVIGLLQADATLTGLLADGLYIDVAPPNAKQFAIVSLVDELDDDVFEGRVVEDVLYLIKAVELSTVPTKNIKPAAARIDALLHRALFLAPGYREATAQRERRLRWTEVDEIDKSIRWAHRGGHYRVMATLT